MARPGVTREQVFETCDALVREGQNPTIVSVRARLGGGSPNTIAPLLAEWKSLHEQKQAASLPPVPEPVEAVMRQVWGVAWQESQGQLTGEREALARARRDLEQERAEMLAEIGKLDGELDALREELRQGREALEAERQASAQARSQASEARAVGQERGERIAAQEAALEEVRRQLDGATQKASRLEAERDQARTEAEALREALATERRTHEDARAALHEAQALIAERAARGVAQDEEIKALHRQIETLGSQRQGLQSERDQLARELEAIAQHAEADRAARAELEQTLNALRIEAATLTERAAHAEELRTLVRSLQERQGGALP
jgi:chromosome segregation ATPase